MKKSILVIICSISLLMCGTTIEMKEVRIKNKYSIKLPSSLESTRQLHPYASLQYQNLRQELYFLVIDVFEDLDEDFSELSVDIGDYFDSIVSDFANNLNANNVSGVTKTKINGKIARTAEITGSMGGHGTYCLLTLIEGTRDVYTIMSWTTTRNKIRFSQTMQESINSFEEL